jgi:hypothetical protein
MFSNFFLSKIVPFIVEKFGTVGQVTDYNTIPRMGVACWVTMSTNTLTICNTSCSSTAKIVARTCLNIGLFVHFLYGYFCKFKITI